MPHSIYQDLVSWYPLLDPLVDHDDEGALFGESIRRAVDGEAKTLLELGSGAGNTAYYLRSSFRCTLSDISDAMLGLSRQHNPDCEHVVGDMRTLRLKRQFDAVLIHDAIDYITSEQDLRATIATAFAHTRPGGAVLLAPDDLKDTFAENSHLIETDDGDRSLRCIEWAWDPDPSDTVANVEYAFLLRDGARIRSFHETHLTGLFRESTWVGLLEEAGYEVETITRPAYITTTQRMFLGRRLR